MKLTDRLTSVETFGPAVALPALVAKLAVTVDALGADRLTTNTALVVPLSPSTSVMSLITMCGNAATVSLSRMRPRPWLFSIVALKACVRVTISCSSFSAVRSPTIGTVRVWLVEPGANVKIPLVGV